MDLLCLAKGAAELQSQSTLNKGIIKMSRAFLAILFYSWDAFAADATNDRTFCHFLQFDGFDAYQRTAT
jgi:hypothetical protein